MYYFIYFNNLENCNVKILWTRQFWAILQTVGKIYEELQSLAFNRSVAQLLSEEVTNETPCFSLSTISPYLNSFHEFWATIHKASPWNNVDEISARKNTLTKE